MFTSPPSNPWPVIIRESRMRQLNFLTILKDCLSRCNQNKRKAVAPHITHLMCYLVLVASCNRYLPSLFAFTSFLRITFVVLQKPIQENFGKFPEFGKSMFAVVKKIVIFSKFCNGSKNTFKILSEESWFLIF